MIFTFHCATYSTMYLYKKLCILLLLVLCVIGYSDSIPGLKRDLGHEFVDRPERVEDEIDEEDIPSIVPTQSTTKAEIDMDKIISVDPSRQPTIAAKSPRTRPTPVYRGKKLNF